MENAEEKSSSELSRREQQAEQRRIQSAMMKEKIKEMRRLKMQQQQQKESDIVIISTSEPPSTASSELRPTDSLPDAPTPTLVNDGGEHQSTSAINSMTFPRRINSVFTGPTFTVAPAGDRADDNNNNECDESVDSCDASNVAAVDPHTVVANTHDDSLNAEYPETTANAWGQSNMSDSLELPPEQSNAVIEKNLEVQRLLREREEEIVKMTSVKDEILLCLRHYETELSSQLSDREQSQRLHQQAMAQVMGERDQAMQELETVHRTFYDLHRRHELTKSALDNFRQNEDKLKDSLQMHLNHQKQIEIKYQVLRKHAEGKLQNAKMEIDNLRKSYDNEIERLKVLLKREEVQVKSLETQLHQKINENFELTKICEELLGKR